MGINRSEAQVLFEQEKTERVAAVALAETRSSMLKRYVETNGILEVPERWVIVSHEFFDLDENAELRLAENAALLIL